MMKSLPSSLIQAARRDLGACIIIAAGCVAFFGVAWLGLYYDDFSNLSIHRSWTFSDSVRNVGANRFPLFALVLYPLMLKLPPAVSHLLIAAAHTAAAVLLRSVVRGFGYSERMAVSAGLLFLLAPAHTEVLHWVVASTMVFATGLLLASTLMLMRGKALLAGMLAFAGMLFTEAIVLPLGVLHGLVLLQRRTRLPRLAGHLVGLAASYGVFQGIRYLISRPGSLTQYGTGLTHLAQNAQDILMMSTGLMSSRDLNWIWSHAPLIRNVGLRLPPMLLLPAVVLMGVAVYAMSRLPGEAPRTRGVLLGVGSTLVGLFSAMAIFLIVTGNSMQPRYTYVPLVFLTTLAALLLAILDRGRAPRAVWMTAMVAMLGWSLYRAWSHVWSNWYPAKLVVERILRDAETTAKETGVSEIYVVNAPRVVGNAYVLTSYWAYTGAGEVLLSPPLRLEDYPNVFRNGKLAPGARFTERPCVFMGWRDGQRVVATRAFEPGTNVVLDCTKGTVEAPTEGASAELSYAVTSKQAFHQLMGSPTQQLTQSTP